MWLYDGGPEGVCLRVNDASPTDGGYVMVFILPSGDARLLATRFPAKYVTTWRTNSKRCGGEDLERVLISPLHPRYEKIKRLLATQLIPKDDSEATLREISVETITEEVTKLFSLPTSPAHAVLEKAENLE